MAAATKVCCEPEVNDTSLIVDCWEETGKFSKKLVINRTTAEESIEVLSWKLNWQGDKSLEMQEAVEFLACTKLKPKVNNKCMMTEDQVPYDEIVSSALDRKRMDCRQQVKSAID
jgi:hypothetical protein